MNLDVLKRKTIPFDPINLSELDSGYNERGRFYETPQGNKYESVTTFLKHTSDSTFLEAWRKRVGNDEADRISLEATTRGTAVHSNVESLVLNKPISDPTSFQLFCQLKPSINKYLTTVRAVEACLYSDIMKLAGRVDLIGDWDGELSIIDAKTSTKNKKEEWILDYYLQTTIYSLMLEEMTGLVANRIVIMIAVEKETKPQIFVRGRNDFIPTLVDRFKLR